MSRPLHHRLSRRERQIMDALYRLGEGGAAEVVRELPDRPAYNSVRVTLGILERKGLVRHRREGTRYIYRPTIPAEEARESALQHLVSTFFRGSPSKAILSLLDAASTRLSPDELDDLAARIAAARRKDRA